jgi:hypothetical protein
MGRRIKRDCWSKKHRKENELRNILITACYEVDNMYGTTNKESYKELTMRSVNSFIRNLVDLDEVIILTGKKWNYHQLFQDIYWQIRTIQQNRRPCNILWSDSDNFCVKPLEVFGKFDKFSMFFNIEFFKNEFVYDSCKYLTKDLSPWMMANLRYYPETMDKKLWDIGDDLTYSWIEDWAYECIIYNKMFHAQGITDFSEYIKPEWNVQCEGPAGMISPEMVRDATIIHCHSTRGSDMAIEKMDLIKKYIGDSQ